MRWSKGIMKKVEADKTTLTFTPQKFAIGPPDQAVDYLNRKVAGSDFRMNDVIRVQTGIDQLEIHSEEQKIDEKTLEKLQVIQEAAYQEAYNLGLDEGRKNAFEKAASEIEIRLKDLDQLLKGISALKVDLASHNESHLMRLIFHMASKVAMANLEENDQSLVEVLRQAVQMAMEEERIHVQVSPAQIEFLEEIKKHTSREFEFLKTMTFEPVPGIRSGGCVIETNYGEIDARVEQRLEQLWASINPALPKVKNVIAS